MQNKINTTNKHLHRNSIFTILFVVILILVSSINAIPSNAAKATYIKKTKTFTISDCASGSNVQLYCQVDANNNLSGNVGALLYGSTYDVDKGKSAAVVTWQTPGDTVLGGKIKCSYHSKTDTWTINMVDVNCFTYTPYIICNAGARTGYRTSTTVSSIPGSKTGVTTDGDYDIVKLTAEHQSNNTFKVYIGAGFADNGFNFNWAAKNYTLKLNSNGGTIPGGLPTELPLTYGSTNYWAIDGWNPTKPGHTFNGWYTAPTGGKQVYGANGGCITGTKYFNSSKQCCWNGMNGSTLNVYAHWTPNTYYVTYNGNGATSGVPSKQAFTYNSGAHISSAVPVRTGYTFVRWDYKGVKFNPGAGIPSGWGHFTLTAEWTPNTYTLKLNSNGGIMPGGLTTKSAPLTYGSTYYSVISASNPTRTGYTFNGWYTAPTGGTQVYTSEGTCVTGTSYFDSSKLCCWDAPNGSTLDVYAHWTPNTYTLKLNSNGGIIPGGLTTKSAPLTYGSTYYSVISASNPTRTGYTFNGWYTAPTGGTQVYTSGGICVPGTSYFNSSKLCCWNAPNGSTLDVYAHWTPNPYTITTQHMKYNPETKDWELWKTTTETANYDTTYTVKYIAPETGYFEFSKPSDFTVKGNTTVQAKYHPKTYNLKLDYAGGLDKDDKVSTTDTITWIYGTGEGTDISDYTLNKEGYTFDGWYIDDTKVYDINDLIVKGTEYFNNEGKCILDSVNGKYFNLTAHWTANKYNIKFDYNYSEIGYETDEEAHLLVDGKSDIIKEKEVVYDTEVGVLPIPSILGANYIEWNTSADGSGKKYTSETIYKNSEDITLYAIWEKINFTLTYETNYIDKENSVYTIKDLKSNEKIIIKTCKELNFGIENTERTVHGDDKNYVIIPGDNFYYVSGDKYYRFVGYSIDKEAQHTCTNILNYAGQDIEGYELHYIYQAYENVKDDLSKDIKERNDKIKAEYERLKSINAPITEDDVTLYAIWDEYPILTLNPETLYQETVRNMTEDEFRECLKEFINKDLTTDKEDNNYSNGKLSITFPNLAAEKKGMEELYNSGAVSVTYELKDTYENVTRKTKSIAIISKNPEDPTDPDSPNPRELTIRYYTRCINEFYYNRRYEIIEAGVVYDDKAARVSGGLAPMSKWYIKPEYVTEITECFNILKTDTGYEQVWTFTHEDMLEVQEFIKENGIGKTKSETALKDFYNKFKHLAE